MNFNDLKWMDWGGSKGSKANLLKSLVIGIKWIHQNKIIHRDLHSGNILIHESNDSLIADLGFSRPSNEDPGSS
ncbi:16330_t:CDS:1, partial [Acaulospora morrowiae]